ncbi:MAG: hypothetical protein JSV19_11160 [Phycisphaerales bacterium]|nr:MAG: hypothetical protein JSV19_11160 [Phycisphaerales bacterium]
MGRIIKTLIVAGIIVGGVVLAIRLTSGTRDDTDRPETPQKTEVPQPQEKYGFAPIGE